VTGAAEIVAGADTVDKGQAFRGAAVGRARETGGGGAGETDHALELERGEDIVVDPEAVFTLEVSVKGSKAWGEEDGADREVFVAVGHVEVDGGGGASVDAAAAASAGVRVNEPGIGDRAEARRAIDGLDGREPALVVVGACFGTDRGAEATAVALVGVDKASLVADGGGKVTGRAVEGQEVGVGEEGDVVAGIALKGGAKGGLVREHEADAAGVGGEGVVEEVHRAADGGSGVEEEDGQVAFGQVHGCGHAGDACADDQSRVGRRRSVAREVSHLR
jgi:hypothetical protein